jgi:hypothetical protein
VRIEQRIRRNGSLGLVLMVWILIACTARAQQINGVPGSPDATVTLKGNKLPPPPMPFGGVVKENAANSKPWWPPRVVPQPLRAAPTICLLAFARVLGTKVQYP